VAIAKFEIIMGRARAVSNALTNFAEAMVEAGE